MRAALRLDRPGQLEVHDVSIDDPMPREVLIRTAATGLCHSDLHFIDTLVPGMGGDAPALFGHEAAGVVERVGADVTYVRPGDHVITFPLQFCGSCEYCLRGKPTLCNQPPARRPADARPRLTFGGEPVYQFTDLGAFAERMLVHEHGVIKIDPSYPLDRAAIIGCGVATGLGAALNVAEVRPGSSVAVIGLGGVGLAAVQGAALAGARQIIAIDSNPAKFDIARRVGATDTVDASSTDVVAAVTELTHGGVDYSFEAIGLKAAMEQAVHVLRPGGVATIVGVSMGAPLEIDPRLLLAERRIQGCLMGGCRSRLDLPHYIELDRAGRLDFGALIERHVTLDDVNDGFQAMRDGRIAGRRVIMFSGPVSAD